MSLRIQLFADMKQAMKDREAGKLRLSVLRMVISSIKNSEIDKKRELEDEEIATILTKEVKMRKDAIEEFRKGQREDLAGQNELEVAILVGYLPTQFTEQEIVTIVTECVKQSGATRVRELGAVMALVMPRVKGRADGKLVNQAVKQLLQ